MQRHRVLRITWLHNRSGSTGVVEVSLHQASLHQASVKWKVLCGDQELGRCDGIAIPVMPACCVVTVLVEYQIAYALVFAVRGGFDVYFSHGYWDMLVGQN